MAKENPDSQTIWIEMAPWNLLWIDPFSFSLCVCVCVCVDWRLVLDESFAAPFLDSGHGKKYKQVLVVFDSQRAFVVILYLPCFGDKQDRHTRAISQGMYSFASRKAKALLNTLYRLLNQFRCMIPTSPSVARQKSLSSFRPKFNA